MGGRRISVVVPTLNSAETLEWTLLSLRKQRDIDVNIVVVDSGSEDGTLEICRRWNISTIYAESGNMYTAINAGLRECRDDWLAYLNSDDEIYADSYARLVSKGEETGAGVVYGDCDYVDGVGRFLFSVAAAKPGQLSPLFRLGILGFAQPAAIFRRRVYQQEEGFDERYSLSADADYFYRALLADARFVRLGGPSVARFRLHAGQQTLTKLDNMEAEKQAIKRSLAGRASFSDRIAVARWRLSNLPHYAIRILRMSLLSKRLRLPRSIAHS